MELASTAVLIIACDRPAYLRRALRSIFLHKGERCYPIIVSQDGADAEVAAVIRGQGGLQHLQHQPRPFGLWRTPRGWDRYHCIARHYRWALGQVFDQLGFERVIILEDDLEIAVDFFDYIEAAAGLLLRDPTIWTVSAWNDNGHTRFVRDKDALFRSDFFPGLGWLLTRALWRELMPKWPQTCWDDWLRAPEQRRGRVAIRPEVSRTHTFGKVGVSRGQFYDEHLKEIKLNTERVDFEALDLGYLLKENYDQRLVERIGRAPVVSLEEAVNLVDTTCDQRVEYRDEHTFSVCAARFGLMTDVRGGVARTGYLGVVEFWYKSRRIFLVPADFPHVRTAPRSK
jgi:alpha-1,3-mannosyl-glycoprotein beta-1,2-N-acetylglucosaminyltransferase